MLSLNSPVTSRMTAIVDSLQYDFTRFTIPTFISHLEKIIKRKIHLMPCALPPSMTGLWLTDVENHVEYVLIDKNVPPVSFTHIIAHELAHLLLNHPTLQITAARLVGILDDLSDGIIPFDIGTVMTREIVGLTNGLWYEDEAETLAHLIQTKIVAAQTHYLTGNHLHDSVWNDLFG